MTLPARCQKCFAVLPPDARFCPRCGEAVPQPEAIVRDGLQVCPACKHANPASAVFCESCGTRLRESAPAVPAASAGQPPAAYDPGPAAESGYPQQPQPAPAEETQPPADITGQRIIGTIPQPNPAQWTQPSAPAQRPHIGSQDPWAAPTAVPSYRPMMPQALCPRCGTFKPAGATQCTNCGLPFAQISEDGIPFAVMEQGVPAGFWVRFAALIIDRVVVSAITLVPLLVWLFSGDNLPEEGETLAIPGWINLTIYGFPFVYTIVFLALWGATPGKRVLNIYVLDAQGRRRIGFVRATIRTVATFISALILLIGYIMVAFRRDKRALHDLIAGTYPTIRTRRQ